MLIVRLKSASGRLLPAANIHCSSIAVSTAPDQSLYNARLFYGALLLQSG